jgi:hypothetical protein
MYHRHADGAWRSFAQVGPFRLPIRRSVRPARDDPAGMHIAERTCLRTSVYGGLPIGDLFAALFELPRPYGLIRLESVEHVASAVKYKRTTQRSAPRLFSVRVRVHYQPADCTAVGGNRRIAERHLLLALRRESLFPKGKSNTKRPLIIDNSRAIYLTSCHRPSVATATKKVRVSGGMSKTASHDSMMFPRTWPFGRGEPQAVLVHTFLGISMMPRCSRGFPCLPSR